MVNFMGNDRMNCGTKPGANDLDIFVYGSYGSVEMHDTLGPLTPKFDRATQPFHKFDRRHWTLLKSTERKKK